MNWIKGFALVGILATPLSVVIATQALADPASDTKTSTIVKDTSKTDTAAPDTTEKKHLTKAQIEAVLTKCSDQADAKGLFVKAGKGAARKAFRNDCKHKMGVE